MQKDEGDAPFAPPAHLDVGKMDAAQLGLDYPPPQLPGLLGGTQEWVTQEEFEDVHDRLVEKRAKSWIMENAEDKKERIRTVLVRKSYDVTGFYKDRGCCQRWARSTYFESLTLFVIGVNCFWMGYDTDSNDAITILDAALQFAIMENFFCAYFSFEWAIRFGAFRRKCDTMQDGWFVFDSMLLGLMIAETWVLPAGLLLSGSSSEQIPPIPIHILRLFRLLRLTRMARMLRSISELMILIKGMAAAARSVFFVMCLLVIVLYVFSIAFTQLAAGTVMGSFYFPTVQHSMYTLLIYGTFLDDIAPFCDEVDAESVACLLLIFVFAILAACTVLNLLIGILCEVVSAVAATEKEEMMVQFVTQKIESLLRAGDCYNDGMISQAEFERILKTPEAVLALEEVGIDPVSIVDFTEHIFHGEDNLEGTLNFPKFMEVILKLRQTNECTIKDVVDLRRYIVTQLTTAQEVVLEHLRDCDQASKGRASPSMGLASPSMGLDREDLCFGPGGASGTGATSDRQFRSACGACPSLAGLKARTARLEELMQKMLVEVSELVQRVPIEDGKAQRIQPRAVVKAVRVTDSDQAAAQVPRSRRVIGNRFPSDSAVLS